MTVPAAPEGGVLVTGGSGFIGRHVVAALRQTGRQVRVLDLVAPADPSVPAVVGDVADPTAVAAALEGCTAVVHLAAVTSVLRSVEHPDLTYRTNVAGTSTLLEAARQAGVGAVVFASTNAVAGPQEGTFDEAAVLRPLTPYGATKAAAEMLLSAYDASYGVRGVALRFTNVYGEGMALKDSIVARLMRAVLSGATFDIYGDGLQVRDYVNVTDVTAAVTAALGDPSWSGPVVIGAGHSVSVLDVLELTRAATGAALPARHVPAKPGEMPAVRVRPAKAAGLGWVPRIALPDGIASVWAEWSAAGAASATGASAAARSEEVSR